MENLRPRRISFVEALNQLNSSLRDYSDCTSNTNLERYASSVRDGAIQRFEFTVDALWKAIKEYLVFVHNLQVDAGMSPRNVRLSHDAGLMSDNELRLCMEMIENRNRTSHTYNEDLAEEVFDSIVGYLDFLENISKKI